MGTIIGAGIFKMPAVIANVVPSVFWMIVVWVAGGVVALVGALCFAELTTSYPDRGGDYGYLKRAYIRHIGFAFSWTAFWVIRPTSIALMAIIFGEFAVAVFRGTLSVLWFLIAAIVGLSLANLLGVRCGKSAQNVLTVAKVVGILIVVLAAFTFGPDSTSAKAGDGAGGVTSVEVSKTPAQVEPAEQGESEESAWEWFWLSMVYVMFTFGGWNDIAFVATETCEPK